MLEKKGNKSALWTRIAESHFFSTHPPKREDNTLTTILHMGNIEAHPPVAETKRNSESACAAAATSEEFCDISIRPSVFVRNERTVSLENCNGHFFNAPSPLTLPQAAQDGSEDGTALQSADVACRVASGRVDTSSTLSPTGPDNGTGL